MTLHVHVKHDHFQSKKSLSKQNFESSWMCVFFPEHFPLPASHLAVLDPEKKGEQTLFSLLNMESPKVQKVSHWLSKSFIVEASYPHVLL